MRVPLESEISEEFVKEEVAEDEMMMESVDHESFEFGDGLLYCNFPQHELSLTAMLIFTSLFF